MGGDGVIGRVVSRRVRGAAAVAAAAVALAAVAEPDAPRARAVLADLGGPVTRPAGKRGAATTEYRPTGHGGADGFDVAGPPEALADEERRRREADRGAAEGPGLAGLVGERVPSAWRRRRLAAMASGAIAALRTHAFVALPAPRPEDRALYGTDQPGITIVVEAAGSRSEIAVGARSAVSAAHYFRCAPAGTFGLVPAEQVAVLSRLASRELAGE
jgi:hypothetical protein